MEKQKSPWVFSTAKILVNLAFFGSLALGLLYVGQNALNLSGRDTRSYVNSSPPGYVAVPVTWSVPSQGSLSKITDAGRMTLEPGVQKGKLQVPAHSALGLLTLALSLLGVAFSVGLTYLLKRIFDALRPEAPFQPLIARLIAVMGWLLLVQEGLGFVVRAILQGRARGYLMQLNPDYSAGLNLNLSHESVWFLGLILLALSQVYRRGIVLQAENELTV